MINRILKIVIVIAAVGLYGYLFHDPISNALGELRDKYYPCSSPITYSIGQFDTRFGISKSDFQKTIEQAVDIWQKPIGKKLFAPAERGELVINLIYDDRQKATEKLKDLGITAQSDRASYDKLKATYDSLRSSYSKEKALYETNIQAYEKISDDYNRQVSYWNDRGGAPPETWRALQNEKASIENMMISIHKREGAVNSLASQINAAVASLNQIATALNLDVSNYNSVGDSRGKEFTAGLYESGPDGKSINVYQFDNQDKLLRVLAHEFGHALGLEHINTNPNAIMYYLNEGVNEKLTKDDLLALKNKCGIK